MIRVGYFSPFVPPEWIAAHGARPEWLTLDGTASHAFNTTHRGVCPCAGALAARTMDNVALDAMVLTTACDQMRYAAAYLDTAGEIPVFLLNVPSTWQSLQVRQLYRGELKRLGRFLTKIGGREPRGGELESIVLGYDERRTAALEARAGASARQWQERLAGLRSDPLGLAPHQPETQARMEAAGPTSSRALQTGIPLALVGGPLMAEDRSFLEMLEEAGGRIVVDASEGGERTLPATVDGRRLREDPLEELVRIYFDSIPDVFRRPNVRLYQWLGEHLKAHAVRGIILRRYLFCDLWHAESHRLRQWSDVPVLDMDVTAGDEGESRRILGRIEAFLEMLR